MTVYADGIKYQTMYLPCGGVADFDESSGISYRCECGAVVGSIGQPRECVEEAKKYDVLKALGGKGWDYNKGEPYALD
jgi:hypothetical protein